MLRYVGIIYLVELSGNIWKVLIRYDQE